MRAVTIFEGSTLMRTGNWSLPETVSIFITPPPGDVSINRDNIVFTAVCFESQLRLTVSLEVEWTSPNVTLSSIQRKKRQSDAMETMFRLALGTEPIEMFGEIPVDTATQTFDVSGTELLHGLKPLVYLAYPL